MLHNSVLFKVLITLYWLGRKAARSPSYHGPHLDLKAFEKLLGQALTKVRPRWKDCFRNDKHHRCLGISGSTLFSTCLDRQIFYKALEGQTDNSNGFFSHVSRKSFLMIFTLNLQEKHPKGLG